VISADRTTPASLTALLPVKGWHEPFLHEAVGSMLAQTRPDWRLLVVGEAEERAALERALAGPLADPRVELVVNEGRKLAGAFNTGMRQAATDWVAILLADDLWAPEAVETLARAAAAAPQVDFLHSARRIVDDGGRSLSSVHPSRPSVNLADFAVSSPVKHLLCWRRERGLEAGGMDESLDSVGVDDFDFPWTMAEHGATFAAVPECLYVYRDHRTGFRLTTHLPLDHHKREIARIMRKHGLNEPAIAARLREAEQGHLRQCLYRSRLDRWRKSRLGADPRLGWRDSYR
jgi:glycosyltransferase involved in cell wall biosynthesis